MGKPMRPSLKRCGWLSGPCGCGAIASLSSVSGARRHVSIYADIQARLLVLACHKPVEGDPTRAGQTHWSIKDLAEYVAAHPELGLGHPSKSTIGVILKRHELRLDRL